MKSETTESPVGATVRGYPLSEAVVADLGARFTYHAPKAEFGHIERYAKLREGARILAALVVTSTPPSREQSLALTHLETAIFFANAAIARHE